MIYLDYAANTPIAPEVLSVFIEDSTRYIANPNSHHSLGREAGDRNREIIGRIAQLLGVKDTELILTSGASEANNLAIKGMTQAYRHNGKHIISTCLEHPSVSGALTHLQSMGYEVDLVDITNEGLVDLCHLKELLRKDTVLVSICYVDSELGVKQPIEEIGKLLEAYPNCYFHSDGTQAVGKIPVSFKYVDCMSFAPHKFFGLNGSGALVKKEGVVLEPLIHGGTSTTIYRSGTPALALASALNVALNLALSNLEDRLHYVGELNATIAKALNAYAKVRINSTKHSVPHILNLSVQGVKGLMFQEALEQEGICVSVKSACSVPNSPSRPVYAVSKDKKNAMCSWRISLSHMTTMEEVNLFLQAFDRCYRKLTD